MKTINSLTDDLTFNIDEDGLATITGTLAPDEIKTIEIPAFLGGAPVVEIQAGSFDDCKDLETFSVNAEQKLWTTEDGVLLTGDGTQLVSFPRGKKNSAYVIPARVRVLGERSFSNCKLLKRVEMEGVSIIGHSAFRSSSVEKISIGPGLSEIHACAFMFTTKLTGIEFATCSRIDDFAFSGCFNLLSLFFHNEQPQRLGLHSFSDMPAKAVIAFNSGAVCFYPSELGPENVAMNLKDATI